MIIILIVGAVLFVACVGFIAWGLAKAAAKVPLIPTVNIQKEIEKCPKHNCSFEFREDRRRPGKIVEYCPECEKERQEMYRLLPRIDRPNPFDLYSNTDSKRARAEWGE